MNVLRIVERVVVGAVPEPDRSIHAGIHTLHEELRGCRTSDDADAIERRLARILEKIEALQALARQKAELLSGELSPSYRKALETALNGGGL